MALGRNDRLPFQRQYASVSLVIQQRGLYQNVYYSVSVSPDSRITFDEMSLPKEKSKVVKNFILSCVRQEYHATRT